jgi:hypothetical protein
MTKTMRFLGAFLCLCAIVQFAQPARAQTYVRHYTVHESNNASTVVVTASTAYVSTIVVTVATVGTNPIQITNTAGEVKFQAASTALGTIINFASNKTDAPVMVGIKIVVPATAVFDVTITYYL